MPNYTLDAILALKNREAAPPTARQAKQSCENTESYVLFFQNRAIVVKIYNNMIKKMANFGTIRLPHFLISVMLSKKF